MKTNLDRVFDDNTPKEKISSPKMPIVNMKLVERREVLITRIVSPVKHMEVEEDPCSTIATEIQSGNELSLDSTEQWSVPGSKRPSDDSGCFLLTYQDGLSQAVCKQQIPVDKTGSSGFWSTSTDLENDMQNYHESIMQDLVEVDYCEESHQSSPADEVNAIKGDSHLSSVSKVLDSETAEHTSLPGKFTGSAIVECPLPHTETTTGKDPLPLVANYNNFTLVTMKGSWESLLHNKGIPETIQPMDVACVVEEDETNTCCRAATSQESGPAAKTVVAPTREITDDEENIKNCGLESLGSTKETLCEAPEKHEYINDLRVTCHDATKVRDLTNLFYTDGKGYVQFVSKSTKASLPALKD